MLQGHPQQQGGFGNPQRMVTVDTGAQQGQPGMGPILLLPPEFLAQQQVSSLSLAREHGAHPSVDVTMSQPVAGTLHAKWENPSVQTSASRLVQC